jgi:2-dehydro-3-deoxyphosphogluconate aldolase/(4S)-4-hydroxy-2-oxoglutarate aldolase
MSNPSVLDHIAQCGVVPVIAIESANAALLLADALLEAGLPVVEITFRTSAAVEVIRRMSEARPNLVVGAGTILTSENLKAAKTAGAAFAVAPGLNPVLVRQAQDLGLPFFPGVATPSEIELGLSMGCKLLKFFPAEALGGLAMLEALSAPYRHTGVRFMPTGGIKPDKLDSYLKLDTVAAVGGTWLAKKEDLAGEKWAGITARCKLALQTVKAVRGNR